MGGFKMAEELKVTLDDVKKFMTDNKEDKDVVAYVNEQGKSFLDSPEGKSLLQPKLDSFFSKGLESWKDRTLPTIIEDEIKKRNPEETAEQKRIRELEDKINKQEKDNLRLNLKTLTTKELGDKGLPVGIAELVNFETEEIMRDAIVKLDEMFKPFIDGAVEKRLKEAGKTPKAKQGTGFDEKTMTKEKLLAMSTKESTEFFNQNPEVFRQLMSK